MAASEYFLPLSEVSPNLATKLPDMIPENWTSMKNALESYTRVMLFDMRENMLGTEDDCVDLLWEASKYNAGDPPDRSKILLKSPLKPALPETEIQKVVEIARKHLGIEPPAEWLDLLRLTDGDWAAGTCEPDDYSRSQMAPFSTWEDVEWAMGDLPSSGIENGIPKEIQNIYEMTSPRPDFTLKCGFKCGMIGHEYAPFVAVYYLYGEYPDTEAGALRGKVRGRWELVASMVFKGGPFESFQNIPALLESWAKTFITWRDMAE
jgi:hypothetical protein